MSAVYAADRGFPNKPDQLPSERKNRSGASFGTTSGVADDGSGLNLAKTDGLSRKWFSSVVMRSLLAGWSKRSEGSWLGSASWNSLNSQIKTHGLKPAAAQMSDPVTAAFDSASRE